MPWEIPVGALMEGGLEIYRERRNIQETAKRIVLFMKQGKLRVVVFGPGGGVGKTTLGNFLAADEPNALRPLNYEPSLRIEERPLHGGPFGGLVIAPGQADLKPEDWEKLFHYLRDGKARVVINVVAGGYHSLNTLSYQDDRVYQPGMSKDQFLAEYLHAWRKAEEAEIQRLEPYLLTAKRQIRMITLITKQDLWWKDRADVRKHYEDGFYGTVIRKIQQERKDKFHHEFLPVSLVSQNLKDGQGELLASTTQGYDDVIQTVYQKALIETVRDFARR